MIVFLMLMQVPAPPAPPLPTTGEIRCTLKSEAGEIGTIVGKLGLSEPRYQGKRYPTLEVRGTGPFPSGTYDASWTTGGGKFMFLTEERVTYDLRLIGPTFMSGRGAMAAEAWEAYRERQYFAGFCHLTFDVKTGVRAQ